MKLPVMPPVKPMLAKSVATIPAGASYEPKWDGFRAIVFRDGDEVEIGSRNERPMTRYFPELVDAFRAELPTRCVLDGEIVIATSKIITKADGRFADAEWRQQDVDEQTVRTPTRCRAIAIGCSRSSSRSATTCPPGWSRSKRWGGG